MEQHVDDAAIRRLEPFVGEWSVQAELPGIPSADARGRTVFEWMPGGRFLVQRWEVPDPAPDGLAIIGFDAERGIYLQHYFDSRGVARVYEMSFEDGTWELWRTSADFSPLGFSQRFSGRFSDDGTRIEGRWESSNDGSSWELDFDLTYTRVA